MFTYKIDETLSLALPSPQQDAPQLFNLIQESRKEMAKWLPWAAQIQSVEDEKAFLFEFLRRFGEHRSLNVVIRDQEQAVGMISFNHFNRHNHSSDIGYWLGSRFTGRHLMHRSVIGLCRLGFEDEDLNKLIINAAVDNKASNAVARHAHFTLDGTLRQNENLLDGFHDENTWSLLKQDWLKQN